MFSRAENWPVEIIQAPHPPVTSAALRSKCADLLVAPIAFVVVMVGPYVVMQLNVLSVRSCF